jgi:hypothetical protein
MVPEEDWEEDRRRLISTRVKLATPTPEATREGWCFWSCLHERPVTTVGFDYVFAMFWRPRDRPKHVTVPLSFRAHERIARRGDGSGNDRLTYPLAAALWCLKDRVDRGAEASADLVDLANVDAVFARPTVTDREVAAYLLRKLYGAYKVAGRKFSLRFDWMDLDYLGISEDDFARVVSSREGEDWTSRGLTLCPTKTFLNSCDEDLREELRPRPPEVEPDSDDPRDVVICHSAEAHADFGVRLGDALTRSGLSVYLDEFEISRGEDLVQRLRDGLKVSNQCVLILSPGLLRVNRLEPRELIRLLGDTRRITVIWHDLNREEVVSRFPILEDLVAVSSSRGLPAIVNEIKRVLERNESTRKPCSVR